MKHGGLGGLLRSLVPTGALPPKATPSLRVSLGSITGHEDSISEIFFGSLDKSKAGDIYHPK